MSDYLKHLVSNEINAINALKILNDLANDAILFVVNDRNVLQGSLTDGDIRRGLLKGYDINDRVTRFIQPNPNYLVIDKVDVSKIMSLKANGFKIIPIVDCDNVVIDLLNFRLKKSYLPIDVLIMAGGRGVRLKPLTDLTPKPLLEVGDKPILHLLIDHLTSFGVKNITISVNYLKEKIIDYIDNNKFDAEINFLVENRPLGTIGAAADASFRDDVLTLVINSDILTNLDINDFVSDYLQRNADISIFTIPYSTEIPYGVVEMKKGQVVSLVEKPFITKEINSGIYLVKSSLFSLIPKDTFYNMTDLIGACILQKKNIVSYSSPDYWLDIGRIEDYQKAQHDVKTIYK